MARVRKRNGRSRSRSRTPGRRGVLVTNNNRSGSKARAAASRSASVGLFRPTRTFQDRERDGGSNALVVSGRFAGRKRRTGRGRSAANSLPPIINAYIDPWDDDAPGIRYPDAFRGLSGTLPTTFVATVATNAAFGVYTDLNLVNVTPNPNSALFLLTPDPSNLLVNGLSGTQLGGFFANQQNTFFWPNGILFTNAANSKNAFGPGSGVINIDYTVSNIAPFREMYSGARLVAGGMKLTSTQNFSTVSGTIHLAPIFVDFAEMTTNGTNIAGGQQNPTLAEMNAGWQSSLPSNLADMANLPGYEQFAMSALESDEVVAIFRRYGEEALTFKPTRTAWGCDDRGAQSLALRYGDAATSYSTGHYCILVYVSGCLTSAGAAPAASTPILDVEIRNHYECQPNAASAIMTGSNLPGISTFATCTPSPSYQPLLMAAVDNMAADIPVIRCIDSAGVEELGFVEEVARLWSSACAVASSVSTAVSAVSGMLAAFAL